MDLRHRDMSEHPQAPRPRYAPSTLDVSVERPLAAVTAEIEAVCDRAEDAPGTPVVLLFTAAPRPGPGADGHPGWPGPGTGIRHVTRWERALRRLERVPAAVVVHAAGGCAGPALDLLLVADHRIAAPDLVLTLPAQGGRMWPGTLLHRLANQTGTRSARRLLAAAPGLTAEQALAHGLVDEIDTNSAGGATTNGDMNADANGGPDARDGSHANGDGDSGPGSGAVRRAVSRFAAVRGAELAVRRRLLLDGPSSDIDDALGAHLAACDRELRLREDADPADPALPATPGRQRP
ncbi:enoyl-CoA hydratase-related protein [Streptomyces axinellae]|uniref:Enoyl-CoA hydratase n=1 Tax=Streptomyces axinellae TaxID=552788 RepID=A0ABP6BYD6_9ACTN